MKRPRKRTWVIVAIIAAVVLLLCGLAGWAFYSLFSTVAQQMNGITNVAQDFYQHMQDQDYAAAYGDLHITGLTQDEFIQRAQANDSQNGRITAFTVETPTFTGSTSTNSFQWRITVEITRPKLSYPVLLTLDKIDGSWKIIDIDLNRM